MSKKDIMNLSIPKGTDAALCIIGEEYWIQYLDGEKQAGKFLSPAAVRSAFRNEPIASGWLPEGVRQWGSGSRGDWMVSHYKPAVYTFAISGRARKLTAPMPALIWFGINHNYYIFAMLGDKFEPKAQLFHAPVANVNNKGLICFGENEHPDVKKGGFEKTWHTFWEAPFNNHQDDGKSVSQKDDINKKLLELAKAKAQFYPVSDLVPMGMTLEQAIERLTNRKSINNFDFDDDDEDFDDDDE
jgi:PRTRC genetic system protein B